jgi:hypothetical protein
MGGAVRADDATLHDDRCEHSQAPRCWKSCVLTAAVVSGPLPRRSTDRAVVPNGAAPAV